MNKFKNTKNILIKTISFSLIILTVCFLAACANKNANDDKETEKKGEKQLQDLFPEEEESNDENVEDYEEIGDNQKIDFLTKEEIEEAYPEKEVLTWVYNDLVYIDSSINIKFNELLVEKGMDFVVYFKMIQENRYETTINNMIAQDNAPDIISAGLGSADTSTGVPRAMENQWLEPLSPYLETPEGKKLKEAFPEKMWKTFFTNGEVYGVSGKLPYFTEYAYFVNKEIADKYKVSLDELANMKPQDLEPILEKVYQGEKSEEFATYTVYDAILIDNYFIPFDSNNNNCKAIAYDNRKEETKAINLFDDMDVVQYFRTLSKYNSNGYLDQEIYENNKNNFFIIQTANNVLDGSEEELKSGIKETYTDVKEIEVIAYSPGHLTTQMNSLTGIASKSENKDRAFLALTAAFADKEIVDLLLHGIEGENYTIENGKIDPIEGKETPWFQSMYFGNMFISGPTVDEMPDKENKVYDIINNMYAPDVLGVYLYFEDNIVEKMNDINKIAGEYSGLYNGEYEDVDATLEELNGKLYEAGIKEIIDNINRQFDENK